MAPMAAITAAVAAVATVLLAGTVRAAPLRVRADGDCDPLVPEYCMAPFPNNYYLTNDPTTPTGFRIRLTPTMLPVADDGTLVDPADWEFLDGFGRLLPLTTYVAGISLDRSALPRNWDIGASLRAGAPSLLLDTVTGEAVAHWTELDESTTGAAADQKLLLLWPSGPLNFNRRYIVAYRALVTEDGTAIPSSEAFAQLRDGVVSPDPEVEGRRANYDANIFPALAAAGFARSELFLAWEFTVGSASTIQDVLRAAISDALPRIPAGGPEYRILYAEDNISNVTARHIVGQFRVPHYLNTIRPGAKLVLDPANNRPIYQGDEWAPFSLTIPTSLATGALEPQGSLQVGETTRRLRARCTIRNRLRLCVAPGCGDSVRLNATRL